MRNKDIKKILEAREIAEKQNAEQKAMLKKRRKVQYLDNTFVRNSLWPSNRR